jgi:hypothetical protein
MPQQQQRSRQQQRRRRQRAAAGSDDDSDYLAADDDEDSADYELSDDGFCYEEAERQLAHRSARAGRSEAAAAAYTAAASGSGGAQQYPQQLPQFYKSQRWSPAEHAKLVALVAKHGLRNWAVVAAELPGRNGKQCRERYLTHAAKAKRVSRGGVAVHQLISHEFAVRLKNAASQVCALVAFHVIMHFPCCPACVSGAWAVFCGCPLQPARHARCRRARYCNDFRPPPRNRILICQKLNQEAAHAPKP